MKTLKKKNLKKIKQKLKLKKNKKTTKTNNNNYCSSFVFCFNKKMF